MLAQWVPLHAVSCSNLIETGECAESREIPLRVTQNFFSKLHALWSLPQFLASNMRAVAREKTCESSDGGLLYGVFRLVADRARSSSYLYSERFADHLERTSRAQDHKSRSSVRSRSFARLGCEKSPTIVSLAARSCLVVILRPGLRPAGYPTIRHFAESSP